jgi:hypothetical protein
MRETLTYYVGLAESLTVDGARDTYSMILVLEAWIFSPPATTTGMPSESE